MDRFAYILHWRLQQGSHAFPGQDGGTCINEAAIVAAGFPYQPVGSVENMPDCFSRPICRFAMHLNDEADDEERQLLLPFVTRLACADTPTVEQEREAYITARLSWRLSFRDRLAILEGALAIGRQADMPGAEVISSRMATVQQNAATATSVEEYPLCAQFQGWFAGIFRGWPRSPPRRAHSRT